MLFSQLSFIFILGTVISGITLDHANHKYDAGDIWTLKSRYELYKNDAKVKHALRFFNYLKYNQNNASKKLPVILNEEKSEIVNEVKPDSFNTTDNATVLEESLNNTQTSSENPSESQRRVFWEENGVNYGTPQEVISPPEHGKVDVYVFRKPNRKYLDYKGRWKYYAPWGYFITQPVNPDPSPHHGLSPEWDSFFKDWNNPITELHSQQEIYP